MRQNGAYSAALHHSELRLSKTCKQRKTMTDTDPISDELKALLNEKQDEIMSLETQVQELEQELENFRAASSRIAIESRLAVEDAELARSFSRKNYQGLVKELIEDPLKRFRRSAYVIVLLVVVISVGASIFAIGYNGQQADGPVKQILNQLGDNPTVETSESIAVEAEKSATSAPVTNALPTETAAHSLGTEKEPAPDAQTAPSTTPDTTAETTSAEKPATIDAQKAALIQTQATAILDYIQESEAKGQVQAGYRSDKSKLVQLYLITMLHAAKEPMLYESYLAVFEALNIDPAIKPATIDELAAIDSDFLHASYNGYIITQLKKSKGWRYRDIDRRFSSYYSGNNGYSLEAWQIVNNTQDYQTLPYIFALNIRQIFDQLAFNQRTDALNINTRLFYSRYEQANKNNAVSKLLGNAAFTVKKNTLVLDITQFPLILTKTFIYRVQQALADAGFINADIINGIAGPKTAGAISAYRKANGLPQAGHIDLALLGKLGINATYKDILFEAPPVNK